ncbi:MAG: acetyl-CoA acetyltransferase [Gammaproteobacteria bacterium RIFCSPHIGHO2_12_FULL_41_20]|nr:MAG: acetyl-CoA acetyltransferase [Gammaproteobacteria bacterium RIFCSPHIGHO2_12_FULL_41_20]
MVNDPIVIVSIARTPQGNLLGELKDFSAPKLGAHVIQAVLARSTLAASEVQEVIMGCVLPAGQGQAPARQATLAANLPNSTSCTTINKICGSGMKAVMLAHDILCAGSNDIVIAGGMESMTNAPYLLPKARSGYRLGHAELLDHMLYDGLEDAYDGRQAMGCFAEQCAKEYGFSRAEQDAYALSSFERARKAITEKKFQFEIIPLIQKTKQKETVIATDERPFAVNLDKMAQLSPAFIKTGTVTAGNSSAISDGAAALMLMRLSEAEKRGISPLARIVGHSSYAKKPSEFPTAPINALHKLLEKVHWSVDKVDLFEINEAFAVVALAAMRDLQIPRDKLNIHGGGCALGHPIGATGARIIVTLIAALREYSLKRGIASLCIGGGEATAVALEMM